MRIPTLDNRVRPAGTTGASLIPGGTAGAPFEAAAQTSEALGQIGSYLTKQAVEANNKTIEAQQKLQVLGQSSNDLVAANDKLQELQRDPDYENAPQKMNDYLNALKEAGLKSISDPVMQKEYEARWLQLRNESVTKIQGHVWSARVDRAKASQDLAITNLTNYATQAPDDELPFVLKRLDDTIKAGVNNGFRSAEDAVKQQQNSAAVIAEDRALRAGVTNPDEVAKQVVTRQGIYAFLPPGKELGVGETILKNALARQRALDEQQEKTYKEAYQTVVDDLESQANAGTLTVGDLEDARRSRWAVGEDYRRLYQLVTRPKDIVSDNATLRELDQRVYSSDLNTVSQVTKLETQVNVSMPNLSAADYQRLKLALRERKDFLMNRANTEAGKRQSQAEQIISLGLTTRSPLEQIDPAAQEAKTLAVQELTRRSNAFSGAEDPLAVMEEILPKYQRIVIDRGKLDVQKLEALTRGWTRDSLNAARKSGKLPVGVYETLNQQLIDLEKRRIEVKNMQDRIKSGGGGETLGRKPVQK